VTVLIIGLSTGPGDPIMHWKPSSHLFVP